MKSAFIKDRKIRKKVDNFELKNIYLKRIFQTQNLDSNLRKLAQLKLSITNSNSKSRIRNRCLLRIRSRSTDKNLKISRIKFRELARSGFLPGIQKAI
jgi:ribosomal protein S14